MKDKKYRSIKVYGQSGHNYNMIPAIVLKGQWVKDLGFEIGDYISVSCEDGRIVITPDAERALIYEAEKEFMSREMKELKKRLREEKEKLHMSFVAEQSEAYRAEKEA